MENLEWKPVLYNGIKTNVEVTRCGRVRRIRVSWMQRKNKIGEIDFNKLIINQGYIQITIQVEDLKSRSVQVQQLIAAAFLGYKFQGWKLVVDHIDSNKQNNNLENLRIITQRENVSKERNLKRLLPIGVILLKNRKEKTYQSRIRINNKQLSLGCYKTIEEASQAYQTKLKSLLNQ